MIDNLPTILISAGGVIASKEVLTKLLGPTADYLGVGARNLVEKGAKNLGRIFEAMYEKLKDELDSDQEVNARVFKSVWDEGRFIDDAIGAEYFGGILASARTANGRDDSALPYTATISMMSSTELRLHYVVYSLVAKIPQKSRAHLWGSLEISINTNELLTALELNGSDGPGCLLMAINALVQHNLVENSYSAHMPGIKVSRDLTLIEDTVLLVPNAFGASLFLRALGLRGIHPEVISSVDVNYGLSTEVQEAIKLPQHFSARHRAIVDPLDRLRNDFEDKISDMESLIEEVRGEVEELAEADQSDSED